MLAFLRGASLRDSTPGSVWVMNLLSGAEREVELPRGRGGAEAGGMDARWAIAGGGGGPRALPGERAARAAGGWPACPWRERAAAESTLAVLLGRPAFARVVPCAEPATLCVAGDTRRAQACWRRRARRRSLGRRFGRVLRGRRRRDPPAGPRPRAAPGLGRPARQAAADDGVSGKALRGAPAPARLAGRDRIPGRVQRHAYRRRVRRPFARADPLGHERHQGQPDVGPELGRPLPHQRRRDWPPATTCCSASRNSRSASRLFSSRCCSSRCRSSIRVSGASRAAVSNRRRATCCSRARRVLRPSLSRARSSRPSAARRGIPR